MATGEKLRLAVQGNGEVSALLVRPATARWLLVLGHGAGAGMAHPFLEKLAAEVFGEPVSITVQSEARAAAPPKEQTQIREDPVLKAFQKHLGGEVVESRRSK